MLGFMLSFTSPIPRFPGFIRVPGFLTKIPVLPGFTTHVITSSLPRFSDNTKGAYKFLTKIARLTDSLIPLPRFSGDPINQIFPDLPKHEFLTPIFPDMTKPSRLPYLDF